MQLMPPASLVPEPNHLGKKTKPAVWHLGKKMIKTVSNAKVQFPREHPVERPLADGGRMPRPFFSKQFGQGRVGLSSDKFRHVQ